MFINMVFLLSSDGCRDFSFVPALLFPYSRLSSYLLGLFLCLISFLLFPCASVLENPSA